ncbi:MAG: hypothetical protein KC505_00165 [Myxococcales bacterium]|nr:hypothetical protein [Myxococcales bacterium]USN51600.1 MAG: hypothetical protein H6731_04100 [Myxococcales bacterium]
MKKMITIMSLVALCAQSGLATSMSKPRAYCRSYDGAKSVRVEPSPFGGKMQAKIYHHGTIHQILKCEDNTDVLYRCMDENAVPRIFTLQYDGVTGLYEGTHESREMECRLINH